MTQESKVVPQDVYTDDDGTRFPHSPEDLNAQRRLAADHSYNFMPREDSGDHLIEKSCALHDEKCPECPGGCPGCRFA